MNSNANRLRISGRRADRYRLHVTSEPTDAMPLRPWWGRASIGVFVALVVCTNIAAITWARLVLSSPEMLLALSSRNRYLALALGTDISAFSAAGVTAKDTDYIAASMADKVIAKTKLLGGGESDAIEFKAPAAGTYDFICTFPGHSGIMKGKLIIS